MKISRIDVIGANGNDGLHYSGLGADWLAQSGLIAASGDDEDRGSEAGLSDPAQAQGAYRQGAPGRGGEVDGQCSRDCSSCGCRVDQGEGVE